MEGTRVVTLDDRNARIKVEVWKSNEWFFSRYKTDGKGPQRWHRATKPHKTALGAIRGAYYAATGKI